MSEKLIGIVGGSGLYEMEGLEDVQEVEITTPFSKPSGVFIKGRLGGASLVFLPRHGVGHSISPSEINYRANIYGFKKLGVQAVISFSAVGSMQEEVHPGHLVIVDQFIDQTRGRSSSFFEDGCVAHVAFADPVCLSLKKVLLQAAQGVGTTVHDGGAYLCIEGPQFSTRAESLMYRSWGARVIGMTNLPEARLAREAELCYGTVALVTDFDCWHETEEDVGVQAIMEVIKQNVSRAKKVIQRLAQNISSKPECSCSMALKHAVLTNPNIISPSTRKKLDLFLSKYSKEFQS